MPSDNNYQNSIAFQGALGAYSHMACKAKCPDMNVLPCPSFEDALEAVQQDRAKLAMIPIENSTAGRVADIHMLLPGSGLYIIAEHFEPIEHCLMATKDASIESLTSVTSHVQALGQCRTTLRKMGLAPIAFADTAGAAEHIAAQRDDSLAAVASRLAANVYGLQMIKENIHDKGNNTTRFVVLSKTQNDVASLTRPVMTTFTFEVKNIPTAST